MNRFQRFIIWFLSKINPKLPSNVHKTTGRASCVVCGKQLNDNIYQIYGIKKYFCRKHAKEYSDKPTTYQDVSVTRQKEEQEIENIDIRDVFDEPEKAKRTRPKLKGTCEYKDCGKKINDGIDAFYCKYCHKWHCGKPRLPEEHDCPNPKRPKGMTGSTASYSRK
ncbi:hypothetical protein GF323_05945 [Candidatus Woesearchaeota archaeon]|nr:hypothetical protein [Candidatus Woesearchaeota archaeon]